MKTRLIPVVFLLPFLIASCKHEAYLPNGGGGSNEPPVISNTCSPDSVYFQNVVLPVLISNCAKSGCHDADSHKEGLVLNTYSGIMRLVTPGNADGSKLYRVVTGREDIMPPRPNPALSSIDIASIKTWINQGALNNQCTSDCDTALFTYSGAVEVTMNTYCKGCHNPTVLNGGVDLSTYTGIKIVAQDGRLIGTITHAANYPAMPQGGNQLQDCQIIQIEKWIAAGIVNN